MNRELISWRRTAGAILRSDGGTLVHLDAATSATCYRCGFAAHGEAIRSAMGHAHVECVEHGISSVRGGR